MDTLRQDIRFAMRRIRRSPGFTLIALLSLALGIGANTAIFTLVNAVLFTRTELERPDELVDIYYRQAGFEYATFSYLDYQDLRATTAGMFVGLAASRFSFVQRDIGDSVETLPVELVTGEYFTVRGLQPTLGRLLRPEDDVVRDGHPVVVVGHGYWQRAFGGDPGIVGREIRLNGSPYTVIGVGPRGFAGQIKGFEANFFLPMMMSDRLEGTQFSWLESRGSHSAFLTGRLAPGVSLAALTAVLDNFTNDMRATYPDEWLPDNGVVVVPTQDVIMNPMLDGVLVAASGMLSVVVGLVLLIACANLASFLLAQARDRRKEIAIKLALGARRSGLVRQLLTETTLLALAAGALGAMIAALLLRALVNADLPLPFPITLDLSPDLRVLGYTFGISVLAGALFGLAPAVQTTNPDVAPTLKDESTGGGRPRRVTLRNALVVGQVAASLVLLVVASLFLRSLLARRDIDPGFGDAPAAIVQFGVTAQRYTPEQGRLFVRRALDEVARLPSVEAVGVIDNLHLNLLSTDWTEVQVAGHEPPPGQSGFLVDETQVDPGFFGAAGIRLVAGRNFDDRIDLADAPPVAIVNEAFANQFWPGEDAVGRIVRTRGRDTRIVGVVETAKVRTLGEPPRPFLYFAYSQQYSTYLTLVARTAGPADRTATEVFRTLRSLDPDLIIVDTKTMERHLGTLLIPFRLGALVIGAVAALALLLATIGLYGVVSYAVASRTREVGIRMSLGADRTRVVSLLMRGGLRLVLVGTVAGVVIAAAGSRLLQGLLFGVPPFDPVTFIAVPLLLSTISVVAAWLPARRASRIDPVRALRS